jgi:hypothetical protein
MSRYAGVSSRHRTCLMNRRPGFESRQGVRFLGKHSNAVVKNWLNTDCLYDLPIIIDNRKWLAELKKVSHQSRLIVICIVIVRKVVRHVTLSTSLIIHLSPKFVAQHTT